MASEIDTEEYLPTCLHIKLYHPQQSSKGLYRFLPMDHRHKHQAGDPLRNGRDGQVCTFILDDKCVSRKHLAFQAYRKPNDHEMHFSLQNLSQKGRVNIDGSVLHYLERKDLPDKALIRFLDYEVLIVRVSGEAIASFEVEFEVLMTPPSKEMETEEEYKQLVKERWQESQQGQSMQSHTAEDRLCSVRSGFISSVSDATLNVLLDRLFEEEVLTDSERETAAGVKMRDEKARVVVDTVRYKGPDASSSMVRILCDVDTCLSKHLGLMQNLTDVQV